MNLELAKQFCRSMPGAVEDVKWAGVIVFSVGLKMFACASGPGEPPTLAFKVDDERFLELTDRPGIIPAPYLARAKWIQISRTDAISDGETAQLLQRSYDLVLARLTQKLQREILGAK